MADYKTGVILGGLFLERDDFIKIFTLYLNNYGNIFFQQIEDLYNDIINKKCTKAEVVTRWNQILTVDQKYASEVELFGLIRELGQNDKQYHFTKLLSTDEYLRQSTISLNKSQLLLKDLIDLVNIQKAIELETELNNHYSKMINSLNTTLDSSEAYKTRMMYLHQKPNYKKTDFYKNKWRNHWTGQSYNSIFYTAKNAEGQRVEAFTMHLAEKHIEIFSFLTQIDKYNKTTLKDNCFQIPINSDLFQNVLDSLNNTAWYKGGDLIVVDGNQVIYNIQIKSTKKQVQSYHIALSKLISFLNKIRQMRNNQNTSNQKIASQMYEHLQVKVLQSPKVKAVENEFEEDILKQVIKDLQTPGITIT